MTSVAHRTARPNRSHEERSVSVSKRPSGSARRVSGSTGGSFIRAVFRAFVVAPLLALVDPGMQGGESPSVTETDDAYLLRQRQASGETMGGQKRTTEASGGTCQSQSHSGAQTQKKEQAVVQKIHQSYETSPLATWVAMLARLIASALATAGLALSFGLYPVYAVTPTFLLNALGKQAFNVGYLIYMTRAGRFFHLQAVKAVHKSNTPPHSRGVRPSPLSTCSILPVPFSQDNYAYVLVDHHTRECAAVDPADPWAVSDLLERLELRLTTILTTHKHHDHAGGNLVLQTRFGGKLTIYGHKLDKCSGVNALVAAGDLIKVGETEIGVLHVPCHTTGHVVYAVLGGGGVDGDGNRTSTSGGVTGTRTPAHKYDAGSGASQLPIHNAECLFTGDAIINGGVGAFFHGGPKDCFDNLHVRLASVPDSALVFSGHEYMQMNLRYASWLDEADEATANACSQVNLRRQNGLSTQPSSMFVERKVNPYFRVRDGTYLHRIAELQRSIEAGKKKRWYRRYLPNDASDSLQKLSDDHPPHEAIELDQVELGGLGGVNTLATEKQSLKGIETLQSLSQYRHLIEEPDSAVEQTATPQTPQSGNDPNRKTSGESGEAPERERTNSGRKKAPAPGPLTL